MSGRLADHGCVSAASNGSRALVRGRWSWSPPPHLLVQASSRGLAVACEDVINAAVGGVAARVTGLLALLQINPCILPCPDRRRLAKNAGKNAGINL
ncbi:hypothetical protein HaLaN_02601 [Haematococcus lacustris]|uniref:Uncharacterized protein n=1 Tax=Haematococcus lacustris TaxID=44745 RepID=A0A699YCL4_HAELA|nr:hypothetical protein HaLaN_02601 [Haematococcus lacustris]